MTNRVHFADIQGGLAGTLSRLQFSAVPACIVGSMAHGKKSRGAMIGAMDLHSEPDSW